MTKYTILLDTSGSMYGDWGEKLESLNLAYNAILAGLKQLTPLPLVAVMTLPSQDPQKFLPADEIEYKPLSAGGKIAPLQLEVNDEIIILLTDGNFNRKRILPNLQKNHTYVIPIGADADLTQLTIITGDKDKVIPPHNAEFLPAYALQKS